MTNVAPARTPLVAVIMDSKSDWTILQCAAEVLAELEVPFEANVVSAHRTPDFLFERAWT
jgi:5-(carboxyamino)imidazole ribonucleotide mutase